MSERRPPSLVPPDWRATVNRWRRRLWHALFFRPLWGERSADGQWRPDTRISPSTCIESPEQFFVGNGVYIGPFCWIEASGGVHIGEGTQITQHVGIVTHSSHRSLRLMGAAYARHRGGERPGWIKGMVEIGPYCYIGPGTVVEAGTKLGKGCLVAAHSRVRGEFPAFSVLAGNPAVVVGDTRTADQALLEQHPEWRAAYEAWAQGE